MPDISLCRNALCPSKEFCYRYTATPSEFRQSYGVFGPEEGEDKCDHFWANGVKSTECKLGGVKRDGEICNLDYCTYPKCVQDNYCSKCHQTDGVHKMGCETSKRTIFISETTEDSYDGKKQNPFLSDEAGRWPTKALDDYYAQMEKEVHQNRSNLNE